MKIDEGTESQIWQSQVDNVVVRSLFFDIFEKWNKSEEV